jgi:hypothetical protein
VSNNLEDSDLTTIRNLYGRAGEGLVDRLLDEHIAAKEALARVEAFRSEGLDVMSARMSESVCEDIDPALYAALHVYGKAPK